MADRLLPLSESPEAPPPFPATGLHRARPAPQAPLPASLNNEPTGLRAGSTPHTSGSVLQTPALSLLAFALLALQTARAHISAVSLFRCCSTPLPPAATRLWSAAIHLRFPALAPPPSSLMPPSDAPTAALLYLPQKDQAHTTTGLRFPPHPHSTPVRDRTWLLLIQSPVGSRSIRAAAALPALCSARQVPPGMVTGSNRVAETIPPPVSQTAHPGSLALPAPPAAL